jgi:hypothetical protein
MKAPFQGAVLAKTPSALSVQVYFLLANPAELNNCSATFLEACEVHPLLIAVKGNDSTL